MIPIKTVIFVGMAIAVIGGGVLIADRLGEVDMDNDLVKLFTYSPTEEESSGKDVPDK